MILAGVTLSHMPSTTPSFVRPHTESIRRQELIDTLTMTQTLTKIAQHSSKPIMFGLFHTQHSLYICLQLYVHLLTLCLCVCLSLSVCLSACLSICMTVCMPVCLLQLVHVCLSWLTLRSLTFLLRIHWI